MRRSGANHGSAESLRTIGADRIGLCWVPGHSGTRLSRGDLVAGPDPQYSTSTALSTDGSGSCNGSCWYISRCLWPAINSARTV